MRSYRYCIRVRESEHAVAYRGIATAQIGEGPASLRNIENLKTLKATLNGFVFEVLALQENTNSNSDKKLRETIEILIALRKQARDQKNFGLSDQIRDQLADIDIQLKDGKDGTTFSLD